MKKKIASGESINLENNINEEIKKELIKHKRRKLRNSVIILLVLFSYIIVGIFGYIQILKNTKLEEKTKKLESRLNNLDFHVVTGDSRESTTEAQHPGTEFNNHYDIEVPVGMEVVRDKDGNPIVINGEYLFKIVGKDILLDASGNPIINNNNVVYEEKQPITVSIDVNKLYDEEISNNKAIPLKQIDISSTTIKLIEDEIEKRYILVNGVEKFKIVIDNKGDLTAIKDFTAFDSTKLSQVFKGYVPLDIIMEYKDNRIDKTVKDIQISFLTQFLISYTANDLNISEGITDSIGASFIEITDKIVVMLKYKDYYKKYYLVKYTDNLITLDEIK